MHSTTVSAVADASELSRVAREKATQGQPTQMSRVSARPVEQPTLAAPRRSELPRVTARPLMGQQPLPQGTVPLNQDEASLILRGLTETLSLADNARTTGWRCTGVDDQTFYRGRLLRDRLAAHLAAPGNGAFLITRDEAEVADKILGCSDEATASSPNKGAYIALGVIVAAAAIFFSLKGR